MNPITAAILMKSLDGLAMRAMANSQNIASAGTPGYRPVRVTFEAALAEAEKAGPAAVAAVRPELIPDASFQPGDALRLDLEMAEAASTAGRYGALVELLNRHAQISSLAVSGGR
jgi:flagellar basal-body rod protein FlgB